MLLDRVLRRPIVYTDDRKLRYILFPGENARVYLEHGGNYEVGETTYCERTIEPGWTVVDVGANIGLYTLLFAQLAGPDGQVHAFEPEPENHRRLLVNLALNEASNVSARQEALAAVPGTRTLNVYDHSLNAWHSFGRASLPDPFAPGHTAEPSHTLDVTTTMLDSYCAEKAIDSVDFLKIDVEGAELDVLHGAAKLLARGAVGIILFEVSRPQVEALGHRPREIFELLAGYGYSCSRLDAGGAEVSVDDADAFDYANYVAHAP